MSEQLQLRGLRIEHRHQALVSDVDLSLSTGQICALVGASGSGKSLTCLGMLDLLPASLRRVAGQLAVDGQARPPAELRGREVALILQNPRSAFNPVRTLRQHALETLRVRGINGAQARAKMREAVSEVGLDEVERVLDAYPFELSGGMLQRMMIALALLADSRFLLADEPTSDLDVVAQARFLDVLERLAAQRNLGVLLVTHDMGVVARSCDHVAVMEGGRIVEYGNVASLFQSPRSGAAQALLHAHQRLTQEHPWT
ncbi:ATP-binding cassette domain-containing protein [Pseudomonas sp. nanlin1]|uniref:ATP-binding cassette domain-containing protein n=1 Tax=Pseudomonas sp. nanlin1 TaxID=3040605 RepID=UPI00388DE3A6